MPNTDNNDLHRFVNLSFLLLNKIHSFLDEIIDRVSFSLVCKRLFDHRDKYLWFNSKYFLKSNSLEINNRTFKLNSYKELFQRSLGNNTNQKHLVLVAETTGIKEYSDYFSFLDYSEPFLYTVDTINTFYIRNEHIDMLRNINAYSFCTSHNCQFQDNIRFPPNIKEIKITNRINESMFPQELECLEMYIPIELDVTKLPRTLKVLKINGLGSLTIDYESLPPNLEEFLYCAMRRQPLTPRATRLPSTLKIVSISNHQLPYIRHLISIHTLSVVIINSSIKTGDIPESVTYLSLSNIGTIETPIIRDMIPSGIKNLRFIRNFSFDLQSFATLQHLETLDLSGHNVEGSNVFGVLPTSLINISLPLEVNFQFDSLIASCNQLPNLKFIDFGGFSNDGDQRLNNTSIRSIKLHHTTKITVQTIPKSVEIIDFSNYQLKVEPEVWPSSIQSITVNIEFIDANDNLMNIPSNISEIIIRSDFHNTNKHYKFNARKLDQQFILLFGNNLLNINSAILNINSLSNYIKNVAI
ncbi:hypothetical protein PPL_06901 [Heterostelium album PN500]|uniref:FNIP repeat-containing protein n=1 Tax=Heterostelium pallidum (strain ATCC 26659 / Pp 5 / PN500) TaxID=670386 RepID=D3BDU8_HETP5|nr:hypothetical protein PPL_06901 [Heterostelium album PN500]EFA80079.1 hypothetical protein PPL_06901 [Heterostelium album PN500]|eukprot:XP_020432199.1 hypothetical protein PPL_06901 [Heterostelium album PN500]